jgi:hypothetical protein
LPRRRRLKPGMLQLLRRRRGFLAFGAGRSCCDPIALLTSPPIAAPGLAVAGGPRRPGNRGSADPAQVVQLAY